LKRFQASRWTSIFMTIAMIVAGTRLHAQAPATSTDSNPTMKMGDIVYGQGPDETIGTISSADEKRVTVVLKPADPPKTLGSAGATPPLSVDLPRSIFYFSGNKLSIATTAQQLSTFATQK
jgi:hypothetical protein